MPVQRTPVLAALKISEGATPAQAIAAIIRWIAQAVIALTPVFTFGTTRIQGFDVPSPVKANDGQTLAWDSSTQRFDYVPVGSGAVTNVTGTAPIASSGGATPDISLDDATVTPGTYGDSTHVGQFTVDQKGLLQFAGNVAIARPSSGPGTAWSMADVPATPDARDIEFDDPADLSLFTPFKTLSGTAIDPFAVFTTANTFRADSDTTRAGWLMAQSTINADLCGLTIAWNPATNDNVWCRWSANNPNPYIAGNCQVQLRLVDSQTSFTHNLALTWNTTGAAPNVLARADGVNIPGSPYPLASNVGTMPVNGFWIQKINQLYLFYILDMNGGVFFIGSTTTTNSFPYVGIFFNNNLAIGGAGEPGNPIVGVDFLRFCKVNPTTFMPGRD